LDAERRGIYYAGLIAVTIVWGINLAVSRVAMDTFDPALFTFLRFGLAVPIFFAFMKWKEGSVMVAPRDMLRMALVGFIGVTVLEIAVMYSIKWTTLANASLLNVAPWPIFTALLAPLFTREKITGRLIGAGLVSLVGVCLVILGGSDGFDLSGEHMIGNLLALGVSFIGAIFNLASIPLMRKYSPLRVSTWTIAFGALFMFPVTIGSWSKVDWTGLTFSHHASIFYNVVLATVVSFVVWNACMYRVGGTRANFFRYTVPITAMVEGYVLFRESISLLQIGGALIVVLALVWISRDASGVKREQAEPAGMNT
jgi:drug/metabolite transporter (DMT)-like permease